jgi:glycosyltransferase involved in cell wall biosynthesis
MEHLSLPLFRKLVAQGGDAEILLLLDNKRRTIGAKRNAAQSIACGRFIVFVDDDDDVAGDFVPTVTKAIAQNPDADCIVYDTLCSLDTEHPPQLVRSGIEYPDTEYTHAAGATRKPWHTMVYRRELVADCRFGDMQNGEDAVWAQQAWPRVKNQVRIDRILYYYRWRSDVSEAS